MKYVGELQKEIEVVKAFRKVEYMRCDNCKEKITIHNGLRRDGYIRVHTWHNDWGNDSVDSHAYADLCKECAKEIVSFYIDEMRGSMEMELEYRLFNPDEKIPCNVKEFFHADGCELAERDKNENI